MLIPSLVLASVALVIAQRDEPCAKIASLLSDPSIPAQTAFDCLNSVPVNVTSNEKLIDELKTIWQWESDIAYLKNTPEDWSNGPQDVEKELDDIKSRLGQFRSEYEVQLTIQNITVRSGNFHWNYRPDILQVFIFNRPIGVASISEDGKSIPKLYLTSDARSPGFSTSSSDFSDVSEINGVNAYEYLGRKSITEQYLDADGRLNSMLTTGDTGTSGSFERSRFYTDATTSITWANGTTQEYENFAEISSVAEVGDWTSISNGQDFFNVFCTGAITNTFLRKRGTQPSRRGKLDAPTKIPHTYHLNKRQEIEPDNFPTTVPGVNSTALAGYFLNGQGYEDVAVLKIITFSPDDPDDDFGFKFQASIANFIKESISANKQKLILDVRENGGGATHLLIDAFMQLFPGQLPFLGNRYRSQEQFTAIGQAVEDVRKQLEKGGASQTSLENFALTYRFWAYWHFLTAKNENFKDFDEFDGPYEVNGDQWTTTWRYNYSNSDEVSIRVPDFLFPTNNSNAPQPFDASNIILLADGLCGSACASFHEEVKNIAGVKSVVLGGRPQTGPMQPVTGAKGGEVYPLINIVLFGQEINNVTESVGASSVTNTKVAELGSATEVLTRAGDESTRIQVMESMRKGDTTGTPLQYVYEAADCRLFYTAQSYVDPETAWTQAWDAFQDDSKCVEGSTGHQSSISGGFKPFGPGEVRDENLPKSNESNKKKGAASSVKVGSTMLAAVGTVAVMML